MDVPTTGRILALPTGPQHQGADPRRRKPWWVTGATRWAGKFPCRLVVDVSFCTNRANATMSGHDTAAVGIQPNLPPARITSRVPLVPIDLPSRLGLPAKIGLRRGADGVPEIIGEQGEVISRGWGPRWEDHPRYDQLLAEYERSLGHLQTPSGSAIPAMLRPAASPSEVPHSHATS
jgi:hypothetical protein